MLFFAGWPKIVPLKQSQVVDIETNPSKVWTALLTKNRVSIWNFSSHQSLLLGYLTRMDLLKYGENRFILWAPTSSQIAVVTTRLCVYLYSIEEMDEQLIDCNDECTTSQQESLIPKISKIKILPKQFFHITKLPPLSTVARCAIILSNPVGLLFYLFILCQLILILLLLLSLSLTTIIIIIIFFFLIVLVFPIVCHLTPDTFVIATNRGQFIHVHWNGRVEVCHFKQAYFTFFLLFICLWE
ncbi:hypothetical protein RFI_10063 [Reticulomyxa filosa]|uniref:Uncharacterized protein n=1 Tax=Reticulomyxa filosa TaxID=46433 RepID=X6NMB1_RETFI|nr:hypothetical protein RFI_10063 [Reticulomyxa filosa]|eukprot:ETO27068.1 hypothetical protein RFI_10063 [Reticulomyxa filosa]